MSKYRVLCLHGYRQNGGKLRGQLAAFRRAFKSKVEFVCLDAPISIPLESENGELKKSEAEGGIDATSGQYAWWTASATKDADVMQYSGVTETIEYIADYCRKSGPFDGVLGFSQGGMLAAMLVEFQYGSEARRYPFQFKFAIFFAAAYPRDKKYCKLSEQTQKLPLPSVHIMGTGDTIVSTERSNKLAALFDRPVTYVHDGGHYIPASRDPKDVLRKFFGAIVFGEDSYGEKVA